MGWGVKIKRRFTSISFEGAGGGEGSDFTGARRFQDPGAGVEGAAGRVDVIQKEDVSVFDLFGEGCLEGVIHVGYPVLMGETALRGCGMFAAEGFGPDRDV